MAHGISNCSLWDLVPQPGACIWFPDVSPAWEHSLNYWATREAPTLLFFILKALNAIRVSVSCLTRWKVSCLGSRTVGLTCG